MIIDHKNAMVKFKVYFVTTAYEKVSLVALKFVYFEAILLMSIQSILTYNLEDKWTMFNKFVGWCRQWHWM